MVLCKLKLLSVRGTTHCLCFLYWSIHKLQYAVGKKVLHCRVSANTFIFCFSMKFKWHISCHKTLNIGSSAHPSLVLPAVKKKKRSSVKPHDLTTADVISSDTYHLAHMKACWGCTHAFGVCGRSCMFRSESRLQTVATGKSRSTLSCILKCVTLCLVRQRLIGLRGIRE